MRAFFAHLIANLEETKELYDFGFANRGKNGYVPTGTIIHSLCESYEDYSSTNMHKSRVPTEHEEMQLRQQTVRKDRLEIIKLEWKKELDKKNRQKSNFF